MKPLLFCTILCLSMATQTTAEYYPWWSKVYSGTGEEECYCACQTSDHGIVLAGYTTTYSADGNGNAYVTKVDLNDDLEWSRTYSAGIGSKSEANPVAETSDGGLIIAGTITLPGSVPDVYLFKTDSEGNVDWSWSYGGDEIGHCVIETSDGGYAVSGQTGSFGAYSTDIYLIKTASNGDLQWSRTYGREGHTMCTGESMFERPLGGYILTGRSFSYTNGNEHISFIITDASGDTTLCRVHGAGDDDQARYRDCKKTSDGGCILLGEAEYGGPRQAFL